MKYEVRIGDRTFDVSVNGGRVRVGEGPEVPAMLVPVPGGPFRWLEFGGRSRTFAVRGTDGTWVLDRAGASWAAEVVDERARVLRQLVGKAGSRPAESAVRAPMPGLVLRVEVSEGQAVASGAGLIVLEAMKMENEIQAPAAGIVRKVLVTQGQAVEKGAPLIELTRQG